jgi:NhaP-type Na+/H+ or K+/H+ antiporter
MISTELILLGVVASIILWALGAARIGRTLITFPMIFTAVGYAVTFPVNMLAEEHVLGEVARLVAEVTLIIVLFADASHVRLRALTRTYVLPLRMLVIGMPLTIILGTLAVYFITPSGSWALALLTAAILTPTDAALGASVVSSKDVPERLTQTINVESGLNDGLALPFVLFGATFAGMAARSGGGSAIVQDAVVQLLLGPVSGFAVGGSVAWLMNRAHTAGWGDTTSEAIVFLMTAFAAYLAAHVVGGNGFIAAFVAGVVFGNVCKHDLHFITEFMENTGQLVTITAFLIFGAVLLPKGLAHISPIPLTIAALFITLVRSLPIMLSLIGSATTFKECLFLGWFGPRGLASILFALIVVDEYDIPQENELLACVVMTVFASIILHGMSAAPLARYFGKQD